MRRVSISLILALTLLAACGQVSSDAGTSSSAPAPPPSAEPSSPPDPTVFCAEVARRVTQAQCDTYAQLAQSATRGMAAFNTPNPMQRGEARTLQLAISAPKPIAPPPIPNTDLTAPTVTAQTPSEVVSQLPGETVEFQPLVGRFMRAELSGAGFDITPQSPAQQEVVTDSVTTWTWQVVARAGGDRALTLTTVVVGCTERGECVPLRSTTQNYTVRVAVAPLDQVKDLLVGLPDWIKVLSAIVAALAGLIAAIAAFRSAVEKNRAA